MISAAPWPVETTRMAVTDHLRACLERIDRPLGFCATVAGPPILPGLRLEGLGMVALPLDDEQAEAMAARGTQAGYGKGVHTVQDPAVRRVLRFPPELVQFTNPAWDGWLATAVKRLATPLGLTDQGLVPVLHELLLYRPGDFFLPHRDGEKVPGMVATLSVQLPSNCQGGAIVVRHQGAEVRCSGDDPAHAFVPQAMAWYADCEHEILPLERGHRLVLIYNLVLPVGQPLLRAPDFAAEITVLRNELAAWRCDSATTDHMLVIPLRHAYSEDGLCPAWLKGADRAQAEALFAAAAGADVAAHLALITYRVVGEPQYADEDDDPEDMDMGEIIDEELYAATWVDAAGMPVPLGRLTVQQEHFLDGYDTLTKEVAGQEFEGYTGNAGMELTRWYHRAAMILWPSERTATLLAAASVQQVIAVLEHRLCHPSTVGTATITPSSLAQAALERWIRDGHPGHGARPAPDCMALLLAQVGDVTLARRYLGQVLLADPNERPEAGLDALFDRFGAQALASALTFVWSNSRLASLERDAGLLAQIAARQDAACDPALRAGAEALIRLTLTVPTIGVTVLTNLTTALFLLAADELRDQLIAGLSPDRADPVTVQAEAILTAVHRNPALNIWIRTWIDCVVDLLDQRTASEPQPPSDHARPGLCFCDCDDCRTLDAFLRDPQRGSERFPLRESRRQHLTAVIEQQSCDLATTVERRGSPYALVCTKTNASYQRARSSHRHAVAQRARLVTAGARPGFSGPS